jgi:hypothetical protein
MGGKRPTKDLVGFFDCLEGTIRSCPVEVARSACCYQR